MKEAEIKDMINRFKNKHILVLGDIMLDAYLWGRVERISPEAPVPVVDLKKRENRLGGAANVALNIKEMGAEPLICTVIGNDARGMELLELLENKDISTKYILQSQERPTTTKYRVMGNNHQLLRVDEESTGNLSLSDEEIFMDAFYKLLSEHEIHGLIFQDYDKGVLYPSLIKKIIEICNDKDIPVFVDPKKKNFKEYSHIKLLKPNAKEWKDFSLSEFDMNDLKATQEQIKKYQQEREIDIFILTLSQNGLLISYDFGRKYKHIPAHLRQIADVSGAGDTVISLAALCLISDIPEQESAAIANLAGGLVCEYAGVVPIHPEVLLTELPKINLLP